MRLRVLLTPEGIEVYAEVRRVAMDFRHEKLKELDVEVLRQITEVLQQLQRTLEDPIP
ncbi:hypothetical protein RIE95_03865 [Acidithiobacillus thiooxidans]|uniref:hypothetical protein n=1 Tax=Acidithiobacillus thiooxidans TaxID=930 RepID=UPI002863B1C8|nr:hypothetical protein [Acidithiobacillus thiooxidans]MDR7926140.1 hypothetical protein [Acidithiobacillus thiooxidans]